MDEMSAKPRLALLLDHFSHIEDPREAWRVMHPLPEILLLLVCGTIAACDDFEDIAEWGRHHLEFLRRFAPYREGIPSGRWLNLMLNRIDPALFEACFTAWLDEVAPGARDLIALDGKTARRSHDRQAGRAPLHLVSAFASREKLVLG
ncbi:MAG: ISAs1 family transposase, partial [Alphaproteobacteria bacterium]|nr:ISAs1 family transposase [Alphaproteobacteria bacterium]